MAIPFYQVSGDAKRALEQFSTELTLALALADVDDWAMQLGLNAGQAIKKTWPISLSAAGFQKRTGDDRLRSLYEKSVSLIPEEYVDGFKERAMVLEAPDFVGFQSEPQRIALEAKRHANTLAAAALESSAGLGIYKDEQTGTDLNIPLFSDVHPVNIFDTSYGTFDNKHDITAIDSTNIGPCFTRMRTRKGMNGKPLGVRPTVMLVPAAREQQAKDFLESDLQIYAFLASGSNTNQVAQNRWKNIVRLVVSDELSSDNDIYMIGADHPAKPFIIATDTAPEVITYDKDSDFYKDSGMVAMKFVMRAAAKGCLPHAIERLTLPSM